MAKFDVDKFLSLDVSYPGIEIASELRGLDVSIKSLDDYLPHIQAQYELREKRNLEHEAESSDIQDEYMGQYLYQMEGDIENIANVVFPRFFRATLMGSVWAVYESGITDFCDYLKLKEKKKLALKDIRGKNHRDKLLKYFEGVLHIPMPIDNNTFQQLETTLLVRNIIAHRNGRIQYAQRIDKKLLQHFDHDDGIEVNRGQVVLSDKYIRSRFVIVNKALSLIDHKIADLYNWTPVIT